MGNVELLVEKVGIKGIWWKLNLVIAVNINWIIRVEVKSS